MSMNGHARRTVQTLHALGFRLNEAKSTAGHRVYYHPDAPTREVKVFNGISEIAAKKARSLASAIAGADDTERLPSRAQARERRQDEKRRKAAEAERAARAREPYQRAADAAVSNRRAAIAAACDFNHEREIASLMMPGYGR